MPSSGSVLCWEVGKCIRITVTEQTHNDHEIKEKEEGENKKETEEEESEKGMEVEVSSIDKDYAHCLISNDPGKWPINLTHTVVQYVIENCPIQIRDIAFARDD